MKTYKIKDIHILDPQTFLGDGILIIAESKWKTWMITINEELDSDAIEVIEDYFNNGENFAISFTTNDGVKNGEVLKADFNTGPSDVYLRMLGSGGIYGVD